jgi:hypothetical protein
LCHILQTFSIAIFAEFAVITIPQTEFAAFFAFDIANFAVFAIVFFTTYIAFRQVAGSVTVRAAETET